MLEFRILLKSFILLVRVNCTVFEKKLSYPRYIYYCEVCVCMDTKTEQSLIEANISYN